MQRKRNRVEVIRDILKVIKERNGKIKPTHIMYKSNLSHQMMDDYIQELTEKGFIIEHFVSEGRKKKESKTYIITEKGLTFLEKYRAIADFMEGFGLG